MMNCKATNQAMRHTSQSFQRGSWQGRRVGTNSSTQLQRAALTQRERSGSPLEGDAGSSSWFFEKCSYKWYYIPIIEYYFLVLVIIGNGSQSNDCCDAFFTKPFCNLYCGNLHQSGPLDSAVWTNWISARRPCQLPRWKLWLVCRIARFEAMQFIVLPGPN